MKKHIKCAFLFSLVLIIMTMLSACNSNNITTIPSDYLENDNSEKYIIQTPFYHIYEQGLQDYRYRIGTNYKIFVDDVKHGTEPQIEDIGNGIIRLFLGYGTNAFSVQYFDVLGDKTSSVFNPYSIYADYADTSKGEYLIAYFDLSSFNEKKSFIITDIFGEQGFKTIVERDFESATCNRMVFLNENEIYLDYDVFTDGRLSNVREVVKFR